MDNENLNTDDLEITEPLTSIPMIKGRGRRDKEYNHTVICTAFFDHIQKHGTPPTNIELADKCNVSVTTIKNHLKMLKKTSLETRREKYELMFDNIMASVSIQAAHGSVKAAKLFMQLMGKFVDKKELDIGNNLFEKMNDEQLEKFIEKLASTSTLGK